MRAPVISALAVGAGGSCVVALVDFGPMARHMAFHIASMNILAPLAAVALRPLWRRSEFHASYLWVVALIQMGVLWGSHVPRIHHLAHASLLVGVLMQMTLFLAALFFWVAVVGLAARWNAIAALLVSGKLSCLLGALLIFAPRPLMWSMLHGAERVDPGTLELILKDQHLAGLLMVTACPLSYVLAAIVFTAQAVLAEVGSARLQNAPMSKSEGDRLANHPLYQRAAAHVMTATD